MIRIERTTSHGECTYSRLVNVFRQHAACLEEEFNCLPPVVFVQALERFLLTVGDKCEIAVFLLALADCFSIESNGCLTPVMPDLQIFGSFLLPGSRQLFNRSSSFQLTFQLQKIMIKRSIFFDTLRRIEEQMQIDPSGEGLFSPSGMPFSYSYTSACRRSHASALR